MQRIALVGAGGMGWTHAECYSKIDNAQLVAVCDTRVPAAESLASIHGAREFSDADSMIAEIDFDVLDICLPTFQHIDLIELGASHGKHICCEKPMCRTLAECARAISICEEANVTLFIAHVLRWFPEYRKAHQEIRDGAVGNPAMIRTWRGGGTQLDSKHWLSDIEKSGGVLLDLMIHDLDWLNWTFGPVNRVFARGYAPSQEFGNKDHALVAVRFASGAIAHLESSWASPGKFRYGAEIAGDSGLISFSNDQTQTFEVKRWEVEGANQAVAIPSEDSLESPYYTELRHFIDCLETGAMPEVTPIEAMAAVELSLAAFESVRTERPVEIGNRK